MSDGVNDGVGVAVAPPLVGVGVGVEVAAPPVGDGVGVGGVVVTVGVSVAGVTVAVKQASYAAVAVGRSSSSSRVISEASYWSTAAQYISSRTS